MRYIAGRRSGHIGDARARSDKAARCRNCLQAPTGDDGTALSSHSRKKGERPSAAHPWNRYHRKASGMSAFRRVMTRMVAVTASAVAVTAALPTPAVRGRHSCLPNRGRHSHHVQRRNPVRLRTHLVPGRCSVSAATETYRNSTRRRRGEPERQGVLRRQQFFTLLLLLRRHQLHRREVPRRLQQVLSEPQLGGLRGQALVVEGRRLLKPVPHMGPAARCPAAEVTNDLVVQL